MNAQQLKNSILQEAIEGRLVPQNPNDEPACKLLQRIREEKKRLVKEGKLKKKELEEKPISKDEIPFEIPESWEWCRMSDVIDVRDGTHDTPSYVVKGYPLITGKDFYNGYFELSKTRYISEEDYLEICKRSKVDVGDILFSMIGGNIGSQILINDENYFEMAIKNVALFKQYSIKTLDAKYLSYFLTARIDHIKSIALGGAQSFVSLKQLRMYLIPLPPLAEQQRIVAKIEEVLPKVEEYGKAQEALNKLNEELPEKLKKSILQEAIEGRLVPQDPNDEPASVLLDKIRKEKARLVKEGKLKKKDLEEKPISKDEIPFEIPESWEWVRLSTMLEIATGKKDANFGDENGIYDFFTCSNTPIKCNSYSYDGEFLIMPGNGANIGQVIHYNGKFEAYQRTYLLQAYGKLNLDYLKYHLMSNWKEYNQDKLYGSAIPYIKMSNLTSYLVALPPLAEQHRIVEKIEQLLGEIDKLKTK